MQEAELRVLLESFSVSFQKAFAMDYYITKYQGKMMESMTPLFQTMTSGIHRLEQQEKQEDEQRRRQQTLAQASDAAPATADATPTTEDVAPVVQAERCMTTEDLQRRARRVCIRLASMGNRCYWLSACEVTVHILTGGAHPHRSNLISMFLT